MIVRRLHLNPFGPFSDKEVRFLPGLNVILGPNEAGKSTLFNALRSSLLRAKLSKPDFARHVGRFLPADGGDTIRVELEFETPEGVFLLKRRWGSKPSSELVLPGGGSLTDDDEVGYRLDSALPAKRGAFWWILMTGQAELMATVEALKDRARETLTDLADVLRKAVLETGGVSVDGFRSLLAERIAASDGRWDRAKGRPEGDRGFENPWAKGVGDILHSYYEREKAKSDLAAARVYEDALDEVNGKLRDVSAESAALERFLSDSEKAVEAARERKVLEARLEAVRAGQVELKKVNREWPVAESRIGELSKSMALSCARRAALEREKLEASTEEEKGKLAERYSRISHRKTILQEARKRLAAAPGLDRKALERIREESRALDLLEAELSAGRLSVTLAAHDELEVKVREDFKPESIHRMGKGETESLEAEGRLRIVYGGLEIEVKSGDADFEKARGEAGARRQRLDDLLASHGVSGAADAEERCRAFELLSVEVEAAARNLQEELAGDSLEGLEERVASMGPARETRPVSAVQAELARLEAELDMKERERGELLSRIEEWKKTYGSSEHLIDSLAEARKKEGELSALISAGAPLPPGFEDADLLIREYESGRERAIECSEIKSSLLQRKAGLEAKPPELSVEELAAELGEAEARLAAALKRGEALRRIEALAGRLLEKNDSMVFSGMQAELEELVSRMTSRRYRKVDMEGPLPRGLQAGGGKLSWERLSAGTKDSLALALRLVMASRFLAGAKGFLVLDDPLVDMDPDRQKAAAEVLKDFAGKTQVLLFTCHPGHAELLGGSRITL